jgi:threonine dehydrogenase-like Zn-dependent dehydrogenase
MDRSSTRPCGCSWTPPPDPTAPAKEREHGNTGNIGVGVVVGVGRETGRWKKGDRVFGAMDIRETNVCEEDSLWELGSIKPETALCQEPAAVAIQCIREGGVRFADSVAVIGLGAIGMLTVEIARSARANMVLAVDPLPHRRERALANGADAAFDPADPDAPRKIHEATGMRGVDVAIEVAGAYPALNTALKSVRVCGTVCSAGFYQGEAHGLWLGREWHHNRLNIMVPNGWGWGHPPRDYPGWGTRGGSWTSWSRRCAAACSRPPA